MENICNFFRGFGHKGREVTQRPEEEKNPETVFLFCFVFGCFGVGFFFETEEIIYTNGNDPVK